MSVEGPRIVREKRTIEAMIGIYCRDHHGSKRGQLCDECRSLLSYAEGKLDSCPFGEDKPACNKCQAHCYKRDMRERVRAVMRDAGPRMPLRHPLLSILHMLDERRQAPSTARGMPPDSRDDVQ